MTDSVLERAASLLRPVPDFPKPGILFFDLNPLLRDMEVMDHITNQIAEYWRPHNVHVVAGFDSRGFLFGPMVAERLDVPFTMIRKKGKLPPPTKPVSYGLEYGSDVIEMADDGFIKGKRVLLIDDLLATGGTAGAGVTLVSLLGGTAVGFACVSEIPALAGRSKLLDIPVQSLITIMDGKTFVGVQYCVDVLLRDQRNNSLILIERLATAPGISMPGGKIDKRESAVRALQREIEEEVGYTVCEPEFHSMLVGQDRDPRGLMVSIVFTGVGIVTSWERFDVGESTKTKPFYCHSLEELPTDSQQFAFDDHFDTIKCHLEALAA